jgi:hypothetical protein
MINRVRSFVASASRCCKQVAGVLLASGGAIAGSAMAQDASSIDTSSVVATISTGLTAVAAIGAAWLGFKYLKKVWNRL